MSRKRHWLGLAAGAAVLSAGMLWVPADTRGLPRDLSLLAAQDTAGKAIFMGKGICHVCHGPDAKGTPIAPNLTDAEWLHSDGSLEGIIKTIKSGVPTPKKHQAPMPPMGGAQLTEQEIQAVAQYVFSLRPKK